jgi:hypothetical protein
LSNKKNEQGSNKDFILLLFDRAAVEEMGEKAVLICPLHGAKDLTTI